jgi:hypothetical protein
MKPHSTDDSTASQSHDGVAQPSRRAALLLGAAIPAGLLLARASAARADASFGHSETRAVQFLEELETFQADFFGRVAASAAFDGMEGRERDVFSAIANHDREHQQWFQLARRKYGVAEHARVYTPNLSQSRAVPIYNFPLDAFETRAKLMPVASRIKDLATGVYHSFVGSVGDADVAQALAALAGIEGRHAATLHEIGGTNSLPSAMEAVISPETAANELERYGFRGEAIQ